jgi:protein gp37
MAQQTSIEWTDVTWNPVHGCSKVSPGCAHCYAETLSLRYGHTTKPWTPANAAENVILKPHRLRDPLSGRKPFDRPCMIFVNSMSDLFHEQVPDDYIARVFAVMAMAKQHTFQVLTKRPERAKKLLAGAWIQNQVDSWAGWDLGPHMWPLPNVWLGVSIENRRFVHRADMLRETPAAVRFISAEPLLGPLIGTMTGVGWPGREHAWMDDYVGPGLDLGGIDWLIVGGESGPKHRRIDPEWVRDLRNAAAESSTAFFLKQWGGRTPKAGGRELDGRTWDEYPRMREAVAV